MTVFAEYPETLFHSVTKVVNGFREGREWVAEGSLVIGATKLSGTVTNRWLNAILEEVGWLCNDLESDDYGSRANGRTGHSLHFYGTEGTVTTHPV